MMSATSTTKQIDQGLQNYYAQKNAEYFTEDDIGKFAEWADENGYCSDTIKEDLYMIDPLESSVIEFDEDFPTEKRGDKRDQEIFAVLTECKRNPFAFINSLIIPPIPQRFSLTVIGDPNAEIQMTLIRDSFLQDDCVIDHYEHLQTYADVRLNTGGYYIRFSTDIHHDADVILICFSAIDKESFRRVENQWIHKISNKSSLKNAPKLVIKTQDDIEEDQYRNNLLVYGYCKHCLGIPLDILDMIEAYFDIRYDIISDEEGEKLCQRVSGSKYMTCSAAKKRGFREILNQVASLYENNKSTSKC